MTFHVKHAAGHVLLPFHINREPPRTTEVTAPQRGRQRAALLPSHNRQHDQMVTINAHHAKVTRSRTYNSPGNLSHVCITVETRFGSASFFVNTVKESNELFSDLRKAGIKAVPKTKVSMDLAQLETVKEWDVRRTHGCTRLTVTTWDGTDVQIKFFD